MFYICVLIQLFDFSFTMVPTLRTMKGTLGDENVFLICYTCLPVKSRKIHGLKNPTPSGVSAEFIKAAHQDLVQVL